MLNVTCSANMESKLGARPGASFKLSPSGIATVEKQNALDMELYR